MHGRRFGVWVPVGEGFFTVMGLRYCRCRGGQGGTLGWRAVGVVVGGGLDVCRFRRMRHKIVVLVGHVRSWRRHWKIWTMLGCSGLSRRARAGRSKQAWGFIADTLLSPQILRYVGPRRTSGPRTGVKERVGGKPRWPRRTGRGTTPPGGGRHRGASYKQGVLGKGTYFTKHAFVSSGRVRHSLEKWRCPLAGSGTSPRCPAGAGLRHRPVLSVFTPRARGAIANLERKIKERRKAASCFRRILQGYTLGGS